VLVTDPTKLEAIRDRESDITKERIQKILSAGVNVVLVTGGIDDLCLKVSFLKEWLFSIPKELYPKLLISEG